MMSRFVDDKLTVIVLANSASARPGKLVNLVASAYVPSLEIAVAKAIADSEPQVTAVVRAVVSELAKGSLAGGVFNAKAAAMFPPSWLKSLSEQMGELGALRSVELLERKSDGEMRGYRYRFIYTEQRLLVAVTFDKANKIDQLMLRPE